VALSDARRIQCPLRQRRSKTREGGILRRCSHFLAAGGRCQLAAMRGGSCEPNRLPRAARTDGCPEHTSFARCG